MENLTAGQGLGLSLWLCDGDLSLAEIQAAMDSNAPTDLNDPVGAAVAERFVKLVAVCMSAKADTRAVFVGENGSPILEIKPRWTFATTKSWNWVVLNSAGDLTSGSTLNLRGTAFGVFIR